jgi:hypothetical protein
VTAPTLAIGDPGDGTSLTGDTGDLFGDYWRAGDRIVGIGIAYTGAAQMTRAFFQIDYTGNTIMPASAVGAVDGVLTFDAGDSASFFTSEIGAPDRFREQSYAVFTGFTPDGSSNFVRVYTQPLPPTPGGPSRSLVVLASGSTQFATSAQYLHDLDATARMNGGTGDGEGSCGPATELGFVEADFVTAMAQTAIVMPIGACP